MEVHDRNEISKALAHRDVADVSDPHLIWLVFDYLSKTVAACDLVLGQQETVLVVPVSSLSPPQ